MASDLARERAVRSQPTDLGNRRSFFQLGINAINIYSPSGEVCHRVFTR